MPFGSTGDFPRGKLTDDDEGELRLGVTVRDKTLIIAFGKEVAWLGMDRATAESFANSILARCKEL